MLSELDARQGEFSYSRIQRGTGPFSLKTLLKDFHVPADGFEVKFKR